MSPENEIETFTFTIVATDYLILRVASPYQLNFDLNLSYYLVELFSTIGWKF
jgi:hypothetical protein